MSKTHLLYILPGFIVISGRRVILVSVISSWLEAEISVGPLQIPQIQGNSARVLIVHWLCIKTLIYCPIIYSSTRLVKLYGTVKSSLFKSWLSSLPSVWTILSFNFIFCKMRIIISTFLGCCEDERLCECVFLAQCLVYRYSINACLFSFASQYL